MSDIKCPFCHQDLETGNYYVHCHNPPCNITVDMEGTEEMWEALIRAYKALDVAKSTIIHADWFFDGDYNVDAKTMHNEIKCAIKGITALEQKDVK
jgi:hypothetical protein